MTETTRKPDRVLPIPTKKEKFFLEYLMITKPIINSLIRKLNNGQEFRKKPPELYDMPMRVLAQLLYFNDKYKSDSDIDRFRKVFDYDTKRSIMDNLGISEDNLNAYFSQLRKIRILDGKTINSYFIVHPGDSVFEISFRFEIDE